MMQRISWLIARVITINLVLVFLFTTVRSPSSIIAKSRFDHGPTYHYRVRQLTSGQFRTTFTVLVIDTSGSMSDPDSSGSMKINSAQRAASEFVQFTNEENSLGDVQHQVGLVVFSDIASIIAPISSDISSLQTAINGIMTGGQTNISDGLEKALDLLASTPPEGQRSIILLSDGRANLGLTTPEEFRNGPIQRARALSTCIYAIGFGEGGEMNFDLLRLISEESGCGKAYLANDWYQLQNTYLKARYEGMDGQYQEWNGIVNQGEEKYVGDYVVPPNQELLDLSLLWPGSRLELIVQDPAGTEVTDSYPGVNIFRQSNRMRIIISQPTPGNWKILVRGVEVPNGTSPFTVMGSGRLMLIPPTNTFTPTPQPTSTSTWTPTMTVTPSPTLTPSPTSTRTPRPTLTFTPTSLLTSAPPATPTPASTPAPMSDSSSPWIAIIGLIFIGITTGVIMRSIRGKPHLWLEVRRPDGTTHRVSVSRLPFRIGSALDNDWVLSDPTVAPYHAIIYRKAQSFTISALSGTRNVSVNGVRVQNAMIANGSKVQIGNIQFVVHL